jgi:hypothetical protein
MGSRAMNRATRFARALTLGLAPAVFMFAGLEFASAQAWPGQVPAVYVPMCHQAAKLEGRLMPQRCRVP